MKPNEGLVVVVSHCHLSSSVVHLMHFMLSTIFRRVCHILSTASGKVLRFVSYFLHVYGL